MIEIAIGMVGLALTTLGIILGYIWRANSRLTRMLIEGQRVLMEGQKEMTKLLIEGQERLQKGLEGIASMVKDVHEGQRALMEGQRVLMEGQKEMTKLLIEIYKKAISN